MFSMSSKIRCYVHTLCISLAFIFQTGMLIFILTNISYGPNHLTQSRNVSESFPLEVTMDWWSGLYWVMIDFWAMAWVFYGVAALIERHVARPDCRHAEIDPPAFYVMWVMVNITRLSSMILWDRSYICGAVTLRWIQLVLCFYMLYVSHTNLEKHKPWLSINNRAMIIVTRYLAQNGLAAFTCWTLLNALVDLGILIKYSAGVPDPHVSTVVLTLISSCAVTWFVLQSFLLSKYLRHTFSVYVVFIFGLGAMFTRSYRIHDLAANTVYCGFLMLLMTILSISHLVSQCLCSGKSNGRVLKPRVTFVETVSQPEDVMDIRF